MGMIATKRRAITLKSIENSVKKRLILRRLLQIFRLLRVTAFLL